MKYSNFAFLRHGGIGFAIGTINADLKDLICFKHNKEDICRGKFDPGSIVTLTAVPDAGSNFIGWSGACAGTSASCSVTIDGTKYVEATFATVDAMPLDQFTIETTKSGTGSGTITSSPLGINCGPDCSEVYNSGASVTLSAYSNTGSTFAGWKGACPDTSNSISSKCTLTMDSAKTIDAEFADFAPDVQHKLSVISDGAGSGTVTSLPSGITCGSSDKALCAAKFDGWADIQLTAEAGEGSVFSGWTGYAPCEDSSTATCTVYMGDNDYEVTATFEKIPQTGSGSTLTVTKSGNGKGKVTSSTKGKNKAINCGSDCTDNTADYDENKTVTLVAKASKGSKFINWDGDCAGTKDSCKIDMDGDKEVSAIFGKPVVSISEESIDLGEVSKGQTGYTKLIITNSGYAPLIITSAKIIGEGAKMFMYSGPGSKFKIQSGDSRHIKVIFKPTSTGSKAVTLQIRSDDLDKPTVNIQLSGEGI